MNNADMPATPCQGSINRDSGEPQPYQFGNNDFVFPGMTKRERFAMAAMQGILANENYEAPRRQCIEGMAKDAAFAADSLLAELDKENSQ